MKYKFKFSEKRWKYSIDYEDCFEKLENKEIETEIVQENLLINFSVINSNLEVNHEKMV
ncbi:hypothetical protein [Clostridium sp. SHJSY1]|uniref:hypothetical protein n=1 Tax=Clostridium sp. SHJSY1 TaxID=2942483 RepID=UPI00287B795A|nr:hypothetical protein [Clostridium sp. SHJSY1]